ncbi:hypothetical protein DFS34DRAFT_624413 [Phlyctochytrium arcticum]|nr:hypothetical protein DFS34DRAFT_624413 [Phlyctochytrium arcticum]
MNDKWVDELRELRDLVARQNAQLIWYQTQHPPPPPSSLSALLQSHKTTSATPTFRAYEDHLSSAEKAVEDMKKQVAKVEAEKVDLEGERDQAKRNVDIYRGKLQDLELRTCGKCGDQAVRVGELLTELEKLRFKMMTEEPAATKVEYLQARLRKLTPNLTSLVQLTSTQHKTISSLTSSASESARHLEDLTAQLEATSQDHKVLSQRCRLLEDEVETLRRFKREMDDARLWKRHWEESVEDHKECVSYLHSQSQIIPGLSLPTTSITHPSPRILPAIRHLVGKYRQAHAAHGAVEKAHAALLSKYVIDTEAKDARLNVAERHLDEVIKTAEGSKLARDAAILSAKKALREASEVEGRLRKVMLRKETEMEEIVQRINRQLRDVREVYDCDRMKAHQKIDELTKSKLELQTEIGDLLRDRRDRDFSRMPYSSAINAIRDEFRRDIRVTV